MSFTVWKVQVASPSRKMQSSHSKVWFHLTLSFRNTYKASKVEDGLSKPDFLLVFSKKTVLRSHKENNFSSHRKQIPQVQAESCGEDSCSVFSPATAIKVIYLYSLTTTLYKL